MLEGLFAIFLLVVPSAVVFWHAKRRKARAGSLLAHSERLARQRLIVVATVLAVHTLLLGSVLLRPDHDPPLPGQQYGPHFEAWRRGMMSASLLSFLVTAVASLAIIVFFGRDVSLAVRTFRARARVLRQGERASPPDGSTPINIDFGTGDEHWLLRGPDREGYREAAPTTGWARGSPNMRPVVLGPLVDVVAFLCLLGFLGIDMLLSLGD